MAEIITYIAVFVCGAIAGELACKMRKAQIVHEYSMKQYERDGRGREDERILLR